MLEIALLIGRGRSSCSGLVHELRCNKCYAVITRTAGRWVEFPSGLLKNRFSGVPFFALCCCNACMLTPLLQLTLLLLCET